MSLSLLIKNANLINLDKNIIDNNVDLAIQDDIIIDVSPNISSPAKKIIDATDHFISPSLIDLGFHLIKSDLLRHELRVAALNGFSHVVTLPCETNKVSSTAEARLLIEVSKRIGLTELLPLGNLFHFQPSKKPTEMYALQKAGCVGMSNGSAAIDDHYILAKCLEYASTHDLTVFLHPIEKTLSSGCIHEGEIATRLGLHGIPDTAETIALARDLLLIERAGVRAHISRITCKRSVEMIKQAKKMGLPITCSVPLTHLLLSDQDLIDFNANLHTHPPIRSTEDRKALQEGIKSGVIDAIVSDHLPLSKEEKCMPFSESVSGISTLDYFLAAALELVHKNILTLHELMRAITLNPYQILKTTFHEPFGLKVGTPANFVIFSDCKRWTCQEENLISAGKNSYLLGQDLSSTIHYAVLNGVVVEGIKK